MERILIIFEDNNRSKVVQDLLEEVNPRLAANWEIVSGTLVEFVAPRRGGYCYAFAIQMERKPEFIPG